MTSSLPVAGVARRTPTGRKARLVKIGGTTLRALPRIPGPVKRLLLGGRSVVIDGNTLDTTLQLMLFGQNAMGLGSLILDDDVPTARALLRMFADRLQTGHPRGIGDEPRRYPAPRAIPARHYRPIDGDGAPLLVFYHGGAMVSAISKRTTTCAGRSAGRAACMCCRSTIGWPPSTRRPHGSDDAFAAFAWALDHAAELGADPARVAVGGDSAGGNLAALVSLRARDEGIRLPAVQLLFYPVTDWGAQTRSRTLFADGFFLTGADLQFGAEKYLDGADGRRLRPSGIAAACRRPVRTAACSWC